MLTDEEPKTCKPIHIMNVEDVIEGISCFIQCWWIISPSIWNLDRLLDLCSFSFDGHSSR